jgi:hypothetical protein
MDPEGIYGGKEEPKEEPLCGNTVEVTSAAANSEACIRPARRAGTIR